MTAAVGEGEKIVLVNAVLATEAMGPQAAVRDQAAHSFDGDLKDSATCFSVKKTGTRVLAALIHRVGV